MSSDYQAFFIYILTPTFGFAVQNCRFCENKYWKNHIDGKKYVILLLCTLAFYLATC